MLPSLSRRRLGAALLGAAAALSPRPGRAAAFPAAPEGRPILTVSGGIGVTNAEGEARFDRDMLEQLGTTGFETSTPWYTGLVRFDGVPMRRLMEAVGARGERASAVALNDYSTEIPVADFFRYDVLLALKRDGQYMPVRDKGPLFIVYPFDSNPELQHQRFYSRSVWQLARLVIR